MKMNIMGKPMPRPIEDLKDLLNGGRGQEPQGAPMASDVETVFSPLGKRAPKPPKMPRIPRI
jgi:hypothetical protein